MATSSIYPPFPVTPWTSLHPYVVRGLRDSVPRFSNLPTAADTALYRAKFGRRPMKRLWVEDERTGQTWTCDELQAGVER